MSILARLDGVLVLCGVVWMLLVPGLPVALVLARRTWTWWEVAALAPGLSLGANYAVLWVVNRLGLPLNLRVYGSVLTVGVGVATWRLLKARSLGAPPVAMLTLSIPVLLTGLLWRAAFSGHSLVAANQDALNHNLWISRILRGGSVLADRVLVATPVQDRAAEAGFYPLAWHAEVATAAALFGAPVPALSLISTAVFWALVLPAGLVVVARRISEEGVVLGITAGALAQTVPLVPGVPMSWGSMTSVVGIALLPIALLAIILFHEEPGWRPTALLGGLLVTLFLTHSPEAASAAAIFLLAASWEAVRGRLDRRILVLLGVLSVLAAVGAILARALLAEVFTVVTGLLGGNDRGIDQSIGSFATLSINVPTTQLGFGLLVIAGLWLAAGTTRGPWLALALSAVFAVYIVSGANAEPLVRLRPLTVPWYGSYERTAWVAVPFLALVAALPVVRLLAAARAADRLPATAALTATATLLLSLQAFLGGQASLLQLRKGLAENQVAGPGSRALFAKADDLTSDGGLVLSQPGDGSVYGYAYEGLPMSNGPFDRLGRLDRELEAVLANLDDLCAVPGGAEILERHRVQGVLVGVRQIGSGPPRYTEQEVESFDGLEEVSRSRDLFLLQPDLEACP